MGSSVMFYVSKLLTFLPSDPLIFTFGYRQILLQKESNPLRSRQVPTMGPHLLKGLDILIKQFRDLRRKVRQRNGRGIGLL